MPILEVHIEDRVVKWAKKAGFLTPKVKFVENGYPDRLFISPTGHTIFIEFKRPGYEPEPIQAYRISELQKRGIPAFWCDTYVGAVRILQAALEPAQLPETSYKPPIISGIRRAISGSGVGQDVNRASDVKNPEAERNALESAYRSTTQADAENVARRDQEVGGIRGADVVDPARFQKIGCVDCED